MSDERAQRFLATHYASIAAHRPLDDYRHRDATYTLDAFEALGLIDVSQAQRWRARLEWMRRLPSERPLLSEPVRAEARAYMAEDAEDRRGFARHALEQVGALTWLDAPDPHSLVGLIVDRVIPLAPQRSHGLSIASIVLYHDLVDVRWYADSSALDDLMMPREGSSQPELARSSGDGLQLALADDLGTSYTPSGAGRSGEPGQWCAGRTSFEPAPPADAAWLEIVARGTPIVRVPLE